TLFVDEAHNFKNISINSRSDGIVGFRSKGSKTSDEMLQKVHFVNRSVFSTGTPLTNSIADLYTLMTYLQPEQLKFRNIETFDMWINTFGERESDFELDVGHKLRPVTRFSTFHNLTELMDMFSLVCNFHYEDGGEEIPEAVYSNVTLQKTDEQEEYIKNLGERTELIRQHLVSRKEDNLLKITTDGRKCALDMRLTDPYQSGGGKIEACAEEIWQLYRHYDGKSQVVFSDIGTPKEGFNVYNELKETLAELGVPRDEIAFIHEAKSERQRARLFEAVNEGRIRVIIGSTEKLGVGVNIQKNLIALHHLSIPWRPSDVEQREGRILRRGNSCEKVFIYRYITEGTFDGYSWQLLENKQKFIAGFLSGTSAVNSVRDISDTVLTYAEVKALAIGNKLIKKRVDTANRLEHLRISSRQRERQLAELKQMVDAFPEKIRRPKEYVDHIRLDYTYYTHNKIQISREERQAFGEELIEALKQKSSEPRFFDKYKGFRVELPADMPPEHPYIYLVSITWERYYVEIDMQKPLGCSQRLDFTLDHLDERA
ncbi:MAG: helicase-related protein, partial [Ruminococcus sp.]